jgi:hypothetical protein
VLAAIAAFGVAACDLGTPEKSSGLGPPLHVVAAYPPSGAGEDCPAAAPDDCGVPIGSPIEVRLDRYVLPNSVSRSSISVFTGAIDNSLFVASTYDVLERVVTFRPQYGSQLTPGVVYQVVLTLPEEDPNGFGLRAFDGAPLEKGRVPLKWSFRTSRVPRAATPAAPAVTCDDAVGLLARGGCAHCHNEKADSPYGLALDTARGLAETAIGRPAHEASTWAIPGSTLDEPPRFGTGMSLIDPGNPGTSYLFYKLLENPGNFGADGCTTAYSVALPPGECLVASPAERGRLADWFVAGDPMPPGEAALPGGTSDLRALASFIQSSTAECQ